MARKGFLPHKLLAFTCIALAFAGAARAEDYVITLNNNQFAPQKLTVPAGQKIQLTVKNQMTVPAEFESAELNREKVVEAESQILVNLGPLDPGDYPYFDDFHRETTGVITAK